MFRPIKNLLTYIQKNASGGSIFGGMTDAADVTEVLETSTTTPITTRRVATAQQNIDKVKAVESAELIESVNSNRNKTKKEPKKGVVVQKEGMENLRGTNMMNGKKRKVIQSGSGSPIVGKQKLKPGTEAKAQSRKDVIDKDIEIIEDIETQIKSSVMLRKPLQKPPVVVDIVDITNNGPMEAGSVEDFLSIASSDEGCSEVVEEIEILVSDEETEVERVVPDDDPPFMDLTADFETFPNNELIMLNEPDLNTSINCDAISEDPLAIDEYIEQSEAPADEATISLLSSNSASSDILWISIEDIKSSANTSDVEKDIISDATPPITPTVTPNKVTNRVSKATPSKTLNKSVNDEELHTEELRSEGSDSGLGSETSTLQSMTLNSVTDTSQDKATPAHKGANFNTSTVDGQFDGEKALLHKPSMNESSTHKQPLRSNLKRRLVEVEEDSPLDAHTTMNDVSSLHESGGAQKKSKRSINFDSVQVYYFPRQQGFGCVPSAGGCTLGMGAQHISFKTLTLAEHAAELRRAHRQQLQEVSPRGTVATSSSEDSEESEEDYLSEDSSDADGESSGFLQPVSPKQRRALLKAAGVRKIDASEKLECRDIRNSREVCGCTCRDFCDPETCACSQAGIKCQVDRAMFPCGCSRDACGNTVGRVEFNPSRVRTHFIHTIMRLEMESRHQQKPPIAPTPHHTTNLGYVVPLPDSTSVSATSTGLNQMGSNYFSMQQTQSNYSSGYASPAYPPIEQTATSGYFQPQGHQAHYAEIVEPVVAISQETSGYQVDSCLEASLFVGAGVSGTPSYSELIPSYGNVCTAAGVVAPALSHGTNYHASTLSYDAVSNGETTVESVSSLAYSSYNHAISSSTNYLTLNSTTNSSEVSSFSSCSVPSAPPYGAATTTAASATHYHESVLDTTTAVTLAPSSSCSTDGPASFINLNSPISSSSRISAINNLLQHNRNTTAALVAVSHTSSAAVDSTAATLCVSNIAAPQDHSINSSVNSNSMESLSANSKSLDTPPIETIGIKSCIDFNEAIEVSTLLPTPITAVLNLDESQELEELKSSKAASIMNKASNATTNLADVLTATPTSPSIPEVAVSPLAAT